MKSEQLESPRPAKNTATLHTLRLGVQSPRLPAHAILLISIQLSAAECAPHELNLIWVTFMKYSSGLKTLYGFAFSHMELLSGRGFSAPYLSSFFSVSVYPPLPDLFSIPPSSVLSALYDIRCVLTCFLLPALHSDVLLGLSLFLSRMFFTHTDVILLPR